MGTINLANKYETKLDERFRQRSITEQWCGNSYNWNGVNSISVWTILAGELQDYNSTASANRFGTPTEVDDETNTYTLQKKRSFSKVFDGTHNQDQMFIKKASAYLKQMWDERYVPEMDEYRLLTWANGAGLGKLNATALTKTTVVEAILTAHAELDDVGVPKENRVTFIRTDLAVKLKLASELGNNQNWTDKSIVRGKIAELDGSPIVSVPKSRMPEGVAFMVKYKQASADPVKLRMLRSNDEAPGYFGVLMEGLVRYDSFVLANKADGIYVYAESGMAATPTIAISEGKATITSTGSTAIKYTTDGTNPKTSPTAQIYSAAVTLTAGQKVRAYAEKTGSLHSPIASADN